VHLNPVKVQGWRARALVERVKFLREYRWSSLAAYAGRAGVPGWLRTASLLALMDGRRAERTLRYAAYVEAGVAEDDEEFRVELMRSARSIGDEEFRAEVDDRYAQAVEAMRRPEDAALRRTAGQRVASGAILEAVAAAGGVAVDAVLSRRRDSPLKAIAASLLVRHAGLTQRDIAQLLGMRSGSSVSHQLRRLRGALIADQRVARLLDASERRVKGEGCA
jgi:transcriptional regulator with XRE-family HTH domain